MEISLPPEACKVRNSDVDVTPELIRRFDRPVPRYTSYPTADRFSEGFAPADYAAALARADERDPEGPLSLYVHLPFCASMCTYCGCNVVVSKSPEKMAGYLERVLVEIDRVALQLPRRRRVEEIHLGGGTPNAYSPDDLAALLAHLEERFAVSSGAELSIEVDPRRATPSTIHELKDVGFTRLSLGVQDFDLAVQREVKRVQSYELTRSIVEAARAAGFGSVNVDLIYGLPKQTAEGFADTVEKTLALAPDRIALFSFAWVPDARPNQRRIDGATLPNADGKLQLFCAARRAFLGGGYVAIGMDHFAREDDALARAQMKGTLGRNFQGYTVVRGADLVGFGASAISDVGGAYAQNHRKLVDWQRAIDGGRLATARGFRLDDDDEVRRFAIREIMCNLRLAEDDLLRRYGRGFERFGPELARLEALAADGFVELDNKRAVRVTPLGAIFVRTVASCFDRYLHEREGAKLPYSAAV